MSDSINKKNQLVTNNLDSDNEEVVTKDLKVTKDEERPKKKAKLPFGHYKATIKVANTYSGEPVLEEVICKPLTQEDYSNGWQTALPRPRKGQKGQSLAQPIHHWSVTLGQLPPHLWKKLRTDYNENGEQFYPVIRDNIYHYTVSSSEHDDNLILLNNELMKESKADKTVVKDLVNKLDGLNSWLVLRGRRYVKGTLDMTIAYY